MRNTLADKEILTNFLIFYPLNKSRCGTELSPKPFWELCEVIAGAAFLFVKRHRYHRFGGSPDTEPHQRVVSPRRAPEPAEANGLDRDRRDQAERAKDVKVECNVICHLEVDLLLGFS